MIRPVRFILTILGTEYQVYPRWDDSTEIGINRIDDQYAIQQTLDGELYFQRGDYDLINGQDFETRFDLDIQVNYGAGFVSRLTGFFYKTYLEDRPNPKEKTYVLKKFVVDDYYERVTKGMDKEYNLQDLGCPTVTLNFYVQPILQVYTLGSRLITNINGGNSWEQPVIEATTDTGLLTGTYRFFEGKSVYYIAGAGELAPDVSGEYLFNGSSGWYERGSFSVRFNGGTSTWNIHENTGGGIAYTGTPGETDEFATVFTTGGSSCQLAGGRNYFRILCNSATLGGNPTFDVPANDIINQSNYAKVLPIAYQDIFGSDAHTVLPTQYGRFASDALHFADDYFAFPTSAVSQYYFPVNKSQWEYFSLWCYFNATLQGYQEEGTEERTIKDAYKLSDVIAALLAKVAPGVTHLEDVDHSNFLYADGTNPIRGMRTYPLFVPKANITVGDYDLPTKRTPIRLRDCIEFIYATWEGLWHLNAEKFVIEHVDYYRRGRSYDSQNIGLDLTTLVEPQHGIPWSYGNDRFTYDIDNMPERIERTWQEVSSPLFDGFPIDVVSVYVDPGSVEKRPLAKFFSDIDFALVTETIKEGIFYLETEKVGTEYFTQFTAFTWLGKDYFTQNAKASFAYLVDNYGRYNLPAAQANINAQALTVIGIRLTKQQAVDFGGKEDGTEDYFALIRVDNGEGLIRKASVNLATGIITIDELNLPQ